MTVGWRLMISSCRSCRWIQVQGVIYWWTRWGGTLMSPGRLPNAAGWLFRRWSHFISTPYLLAGVLFFVGRHQFLLTFFSVLASVEANWTHTSAVFKRSPRLMAYSFCCFVPAERCHWEPSSGYCILAQDHNSPGPCAVCVWPRLDDCCFRTMFSTLSVFAWQRGTVTILFHEIPCPGVR